MQRKREKSVLNSITPDHKILTFFSLPCNRTTNSRFIIEKQSQNRAQDLSISKGLNRKVLRLIPIFEAKKFVLILFLRAFMLIAVAGYLHFTIFCVLHGFLLCRSVISQPAQTMSGDKKRKLDEGGSSESKEKVLLCFTRKLSLTSLTVLR